MYIQVSSILAAPAHQVWELLQKTATLQFIATGMVQYQTARELPPRWSVGETVNLKPKLFHRFDQGDYFVTFTDIDAITLTMVTSEKSAVISRWRHVMRVQELANNQCVYTDEIYIEAGSRTWLVSVFAYGFYHYRHHRWKLLLHKNSSAA